MSVTSEPALVHVPYISALLELIQLMSECWRVNVWPPWNSLKLLYGSTCRLFNHFSDISIFIFFQIIFFQIIEKYIAKKLNCLIQTRFGLYFINLISLKTETSEEHMSLKSVIYYALLAIYSYC